MSMMGPEEDMDPMIAEAKRFMENYYRTFDANREGLVNLYRERSVLTFDSRKIQGKGAILAKLTSFPQCHHEIAYFKCAPDRSAPAPVGVFVRVHGGTWLGGTKDESDAAIIHRVSLPPSLSRMKVGGTFIRPIHPSTARKLLHSSTIWDALGSQEASDPLGWIACVQTETSPLGIASVLPVISNAHLGTTNVRRLSIAIHLNTFHLDTANFRLSISKVRLENRNVHDETCLGSVETGSVSLMMV
ncbi:hypothetical protein BT93_H2944 [Corymbia citriodora subsp. variegata]|nr:hypothetical protein BT93_H2944 [Corymbia citriodora subsp. variegata]